MLQFKSRFATVEGTMAADVALADPGEPTGTRFAKVSEFENQQQYSESQIRSDSCFEDIVGRSDRCRKFLSKSRSSRLPIPQSCFTGTRERGRNSLSAEFTLSVIARHRRLIKLMARALLAATILIAATLTAEPRCSSNLAVQPSRSSSNRHQVILEAYINNAGPYAFLFRHRKPGDNDRRVACIGAEPADHSTATLVGVSLQGKAGRYALANSVRVGDQAKVESLYVLSFDMKDIAAARYAVRGLLGEDFLSHFDATIDNTHNRVCFTRVGQMTPDRHQGVRVPVEQRPKIK